jgi:hypothetical protein
MTAGVATGASKATREMTESQTTLSEFVNGEATGEGDADGAPTPAENAANIGRLIDLVQDLTDQVGDVAGQDDEVAADLREYNQTRETPVFRHIAAADLKEVLDTAKDATAAIEASEYDDVLDLLLYAERRAFDNRVTVIDAITERKRALEEQCQAADGSVERTTQPEDVTPAALRRSRWAPPPRPASGAGRPASAAELRCDTPASRRPPATVTTGRCSTVRSAARIKNAGEHLNTHFSTQP